MKIALVDDEQECLDEMVHLCNNFGAHHNCHIETTLFFSGEAFLKALDDNAFSVVFMDIYMNGIDGIATALKMREQSSRCILVFLTSSTEFMPDAFTCHAFDYITKPFSSQRIENVLIDALKILPVSRKYIEVSSSRRLVRVLLDDIVSIITDAHYLIIGLADGTAVRSRMTMSEFIRLVENDTRFITVNKGISVNADYILDFDNNCCILENGSRLPIRVRDHLKVEQAVQDYNFNKIRNYQRYGREDLM